MLLPCGNFEKCTQDPVWVLDERRSAAVRFFQMTGSRFPGPIPDRCGKMTVIWTKPHVQIFPDAASCVKYGLQAPGADIRADL